MSTARETVHSTLRLTDRHHESIFGGSNFTPLSLRPNPESLQEFQIVTSNFTADSAAAAVPGDLRDPSALMIFTGNLFEYYQTPGLNANEYANISTAALAAIRTAHFRRQLGRAYS